MAPRIEQIAHDLVDAMEPSGELDLVEAFNAPLPATVIAELLGIPQQHHRDFRRWSGQTLRVASPEHRPALAALHGLLAELIADKRRRPQDDLLSALVAVRDQEDGRLSEEELVGTAMMLVVAGHESTVNLLGNAVLALLQHPDQLRLLREKPELLPGAVEEFLRYDTSVERSTSRYAAQDLELAGVSIPRGGMIAVALGSAGHDAPQDDGDAPAVLDVTRPAPGTWPSATASTTAWAPRSPGWRRPSPCASCCPASANWNWPSRGTRSTGSAPASSAAYCPFPCGIASVDGGRLPRLRGVVGGGRAGHGGAPHPPRPHATRGVLQSGSRSMRTSSR